MSSEATNRAGSSSGSRAYPVGEPIRDADADAVIHAINRSAHPRRLDEMTYNEEHRHCLKFLGNRLPGFGDPRDDCGEFVPESTYFCTENAHVTPLPRNCYQYDCPMHAPHAVRRRAAGTKDASGICPKLDALARWLGAYYGVSHGFYHVVISPPDDWTFESDDPLGRAVGVGNQEGVVREIMDEIGLQGLVALHEYRGEHEDHEQNDMGEWGDRLAPFDDEPREWRGDVRDELKDGVHFHAVGVAHHIDLSITEQVEKETRRGDDHGWTISVIEQEDGLRIGPEDGTHAATLAAMARVVTYVLSHASVLDVGDQRRLAAWLKGPDVNAVDVLPKNKRQVQALVYEAASATLGITPPDLTCCETVQNVVDVGRRDRLPEVERERASPLEDVLSPQGPQGPPEPSIPTARTTQLVESSGTAAPRRRDRDGGGGGSAGRLDLPDDRDADLWGSASGGSASGSGGSSSTTAVADDDDQNGHHECGGKLEHISLAWGYLTDPEWRAQADAVDELEDKYVCYKHHLADKGQDLGDERRRDEIPEFQTGKPFGHTIDGYDPPD